MSALTSIKMGLLLARLKLGRIFTQDWEKDPDPENWRTINGAKVHLNNGKIDGGAGGKFLSNAWVGKKSHGHNSFFPLEQMQYKKGAMANAKSSEVTSQAGAAGASQAKQAAKAASQSKAANAEAEGQTSAIATMQEYMQQKKKPHKDIDDFKNLFDKYTIAPFAEKDAILKELAEKHDITTGQAIKLMTMAYSKTPGKNTDEYLEEKLKKFKEETAEKAAKQAPPEESVPFGSPEPSNEPPEKVAKQLINKMKKAYADAPSYIQYSVDKVMENPALAYAWLPDEAQKHEEIVQTALDLYKAKKLTKLATQNILAKTMQYPQHILPEKLGEIWKANPPDTSPKKAPTLTEQLKEIEQAMGSDFVKKHEAFQTKHKLKASQMHALKTQASQGATEPQLKEMLKKFKAENKPKAAAKVEKEKAYIFETKTKLVSAFTPEKIKKLESLSPAEKKSEWEKLNQMPNKIWFNQGPGDKQQEAAQKYFDPIVSKWHKEMSAQEMDAVQHYTGSGYTHINRMLRGLDSIDSSTVEKIKQIDKALEKLPDNTKTMSIRRGVHDDVLSLIKKAPNGIYVDQGYTSTSPCSKGGFGGTVDLEIIVPPGMGKMAWVDDISLHKGELELILPRGARYMVCDINEGKSKPKVRLMLLGFEPNKIKKVD